MLTLSPFLVGRLDNFEGGNYPNIRNVLFEHRIDDKKHIQLEYWSCPGREKVRIAPLAALSARTEGSADTLPTPRFRSKMRSGNRSNRPPQVSVSAPRGQSQLRVFVPAFPAHN
jgi:hypothetical protein